MGLIVNMNDFDTQNLFENIPKEVKVQISAEQLRLQIMERHDPSEMAEFTRTVPIAFDQFQDAVNYAQNLLKRAKRTKRPGGVWFLGEGGSGKSFLLEQILKQYQPEESVYARICPILYLAFSSKPSESEILLSLLYQLGQDLQLTRTRSNSELEKILISALDVAKTIAILCDEAQHLWLNVLAARVADRVGGRAGDLLKRIYDQSGVAFIFAGTMGLHKILDGDTQAATRWKGVFNLKTFTLGDEFADILAALDEATPMREIAQLDQQAESLFLVTNGNFRNLKDFLAEAVFLAASENQPSIAPFLHQACKNTFGDKPNPFIP